MRWIIVSNRLPLTVNADGELSRASGGLVTALSGVHNQAEQVWVGIAPAEISSNQWHELDPALTQVYVPVFIEPDLYDRYYNGMANDVFWPLFHYEASLIKFEPQNWEAYREVNQVLAQTISTIAQPGDLVWIHDFHLFLLPRLLRQLQPELKSGFFLHIPFPSSELFRQLPVRHEVLSGILGADLIGFHDYSYLRHFCSALKSVFDLDSNLMHLIWERRNLQLGVFPVSIDTSSMLQATQSAETAAVLQRYNDDKSYKYLILGVDRLDYSKGLLLKLQIFRNLLQNNPELQGQVTLLQIAIPTRQDVEEYQKLRLQMEQLIGEINGKYAHPNYVPVQYMYSSISFHELLALYRMADVMLVTSQRDGMNLVAMEYLVSQPPENPGTLVLSEFTGASSVLSGAMVINPWDSQESACILAQALNLPLHDRQQRYQSTVKFLQGYTASDWAAGFMDTLAQSGAGGQQDRQQTLKTRENIQAVLAPVCGGPLLIFLDYDGTLVPIEKRPELAVMSTVVFGLLSHLVSYKDVQIVVVSGRPGSFLNAQFQTLPISLAAEHGATFYSPTDKIWESQVWSDRDSWYASAEHHLEHYSLRVPNSFVEKKDYSLAWHYRLSPSVFAEYQASKLKEELESGFSNLPVTVLAGKKVVEVRVVEANKGYFVRNYLAHHLNAENHPQILAIGDDTTDEEMMAALPETALTFRVGEDVSRARYRLQNQSDVLVLLDVLGQIQSKQK
jgi:trehalose 6-phosphate synthase/phosphatase